MSCLVNPSSGAPLSRPVSGTITLLGGGPGASGLDFKRLPGTLIGVNDAGLHAPCQAVLSMDRLWAENRYHDLAAAHHQRPFVLWLRRQAVQNFNLGLPSWVSIFECDHTTNVLSTKPATFNGTNSGACALNYAFQLKPKTIYLVGYDYGTAAADPPYWYKSYQWKIGRTPRKRWARWAAGFDECAPALKAAGIEVINASPTSAIACFPKVDPKSILT